MPIIIILWLAVGLFFSLGFRDFSLTRTVLIVVWWPLIVVCTLVLVVLAKKGDKRL